MLFTYLIYYILKYIYILLSSLITIISFASTPFLFFYFFPPTHLAIINVSHLIFFLFVKHTHTYIYEKGDQTMEYTHTPTPKLHATVSVAEQVINPFSISHLTDVG